MSFPAHNRKRAVRGARLFVRGTAPLLACSLLSAAPAAAWGLAAHQAVTARAIDTLPKGLKEYYKAHRLEMPTLSLEATAAEEATDRRFAADRMLPFPFLDLARTEAALKAGHAEAADKAGRLPWLIQESYGRLVEAFRAKDKNRILAESDAISALVADLHNPLALTDNADGQKTGQHGLWTRFTARLPEVLQGMNRLKLEPDAAHFLDQPKEHVFSMMNATYVWLDNVLYEEDLAHRGHSDYGDIYYEDLAGRAGPVVRERLSKAAGNAGSYWYTAWTEAGRPELK
jgi:hypothetical protein